uniref:Uncharacterized protein n=1 Tax=Tanacetum cinerariifolium TaxID=118510 RepID=A0A699TM54_TANCI|nr:hypothetical protein [Tanacetum cinerariifolium]
MGKGLEVPTDTHHTPVVTQPSSSQPQKKQKSKRKQRKETEVPHIEPQTEESVPTPSNDPLPSVEDRMQLSELMELCTKLSDKEFCSAMASAIICLATNQKFNFSKYILDNMVKNLEARVKFFMFSKICPSVCESSTW